MKPATFVFMMKGDEIVDIKVEYPLDFTEQMFFYGEKYSFLPTRTSPSARSSYCRTVTRECN